MSITFAHHSNILAPFPHPISHLQATHAKNPNAREVQVRYGITTPHRRQLAPPPRPPPANPPDQTAFCQTNPIPFPNTCHSLERPPRRAPAPTNRPSTPGIIITKRTHFTHAGPVRHVLVSATYAGFFESAPGH